MSNVISTIRAALSTVAAFQSRVIELRALAHQVNALSDAKTLREFLRPGVAKFYGHAADAKFTREMQAERQALSRLARAVMGPSLAHAADKKAPRVARELQSTISALLETYTAAQIREAIKRAQ